jgi:outer membrane protein TolC
MIRCLVLASACFPAVVFPAEAGGGADLVLSLEEVLARGLENNLNLKKNLLDLSAAEYAADNLWSEIFPSISGSAAAAYSSALFSGGGFEINDQGRSLSAGMGINLTLNAGIPYGMNNIRLAYQTRLLNYEDARNQLEIQLTKNFYSLIADRDNLAHLEDMLRLAELQYERNRIAFNNGLAGELAVMQTRLGVENARYNLSAARSAYATRMGEFLASLGMEQNARAELRGKIEIAQIDLDPEALIQEYLPRRPDIVSRRQEIERLENAEKQTALSAKAPSLRLSLDWSSRNFDPFADTVSGSASVSIPIDPWIPGARTAQSIRNARVSVEKAKLDLKITEDGAITQIRSLIANLRNTWGSIEIARLSLGVAERNYQLTEQGFRNGTVESLTLEDARNNLGTVRQRLLQSELSYQTMMLDLSAALNINWKDLTK